MQYAHGRDRSTSERIRSSVNAGGASEKGNSSSGTKYRRPGSQVAAVSNVHSERANELTPHSDAEQAQKARVEIAFSCFSPPTRSNGLAATRVRRQGPGEDCGHHQDRIDSAQGISRPFPPKYLNSLSAAQNRPTEGGIDVYEQGEAPAGPSTLPVPAVESDSEDDRSDDDDGPRWEPKQDREGSDLPVTHEIVMKDHSKVSSRRIVRKDTNSLRIVADRLGTLARPFRNPSHLRIVRLRRQALGLWRNECRI